jgi:hypothetical protein
VKKHKNMVAASFVFSLAPFIALVPLLASCASSGLYNMSDEWCTKHLDASAARCPENHAPAQRTAGIEGHASRSGPTRQ